MKRVACYVRVSTQEQKKHGLSVDNQIDALKAFCDENGYICQGIYNDAGISARKSYKKRPALLELIKQCDAGQIDLVIFTRLDRFFRSVPDYYACVEQMAGVPWRAIWEDYETETSAGTFKVNIMLSIAQAEADRTGEKIKSVLEYKKANGDYVGNVPFGYVREKGKLFKDNETAPIVKSIFKTYFNTYSTIKTYRKAQELGYTKTVEAMRRMLRNPAYSGGDGFYSCEPYITQQQHEEILESIKKRTKVTKNKYDYLFSGICKCAICGSRMAGQSADYKGKKVPRYTCAHYSSKHPNNEYVTLAERKIESFLLDELDDLIFYHNVNITYSSSAEKRKELIAKQKKLEERKERIGLRFEMGDISVDEYKDKILEIKKEMASITIPKDVKPIQIQKDWKDLYLELDKCHRATFWRKILKEITIYPASSKKKPDIKFYT